MYRQMLMFYYVSNFCLHLNKLHPPSLHATQGGLNVVLCATQKTN